MFGRNGTEIKGMTLITNSAEIVGDVHFTQELHISGKVKGNVLAEDGSSARVELSREGEVHGEIRVPNVVIDGRVHGDVHASESVELAASANVTGNVYYILIEMVRGAKVNGNLVYVGDKGEMHSQPAQSVSSEDLAAT